MVVDVVVAACDDVVFDDAGFKVTTMVVVPLSATIVTCPV
jgi:hypothetical protein